MYVTTDKANYLAGELVQWSLAIDIGDSTAASNFGIAAISANLVDNLGETLNPGTVNVTGAPNFSGYDITSGGVWDAPTSTLYEVSVLDFQHDPGTIGAHGGSLNNILLATGSFTANIAGNHILEVSAGSTNTHFTAANQDFFLASTYTAINFSNASFSVAPAAVPEPSSIALMIVGGFLMRKKIVKRFKKT